MYYDSELAAAARVLRGAREVVAAGFLDARLVLRAVAVALIPRTEVARFEARAAPADKLFLAVVGGLDLAVVAVLPIV